jgi:hypothetical protein
MLTRRITFALATGLALAPAAGTSAQPLPQPLQPRPRVEIGAVARTDRVMVEAGGSGSTAVGGAVVKVALTKTYGLEAEITKAANTIHRGNEGPTISYAPPGSSRAEIERLSAVVRHDHYYRPGIGTAFAFTARTTVSPRVGLVGRVGASMRRYEREEDNTILSVPPGIDPALPARQLPDTRTTQGRGGLLFGADVPVTISSRLTVSPELRYVWGGPARIGNKHREFGLGATVAWHF